jgi:hypothetical protein
LNSSGKTNQTWVSLKKTKKKKKEQHKQSFSPKSI